MPSPLLNRSSATRFDLDGPIAARLRGITDQWLLVAPQANPAMLEMFRDRNANPLRVLLPWSGEFAGKYLVSAIQALRLTGDPRLREQIRQVVERLLRFQRDDGYLGPWPDGYELKNHAPNCRHLAAGCTEDLHSWDTWGHYHIILALHFWHEETGDPATRNALIRIGDRLCAEFLGQTESRLADRGWTGMNFGILHGICLVYKISGDRRHLDLARQWVDELAARDANGNPLACDLLEPALRGTPFHATPNPRWEALHQVMAFAELFWITGDERYRNAFVHTWWSIAEFDRHNNGGFSSGESAVGNPYDLRQIETCCTIAWAALSVEMLKLTGDSRAADELELTLYNSTAGSFSSTGRWSTYNTPMNGVRRSSAHSIVFQAREGSPELNCCSVNAPRGFGLLSEWALMQHPEGLALNTFGPGTIEAKLPSGKTIRLAQESAYPRNPDITIKVEPDQPVRFALHLRIPAWSRQTNAAVNGEPLDDLRPGTYLTIERTWQPGDRIDLTLDFTIHAWTGERQCADRVSLYRGPLLLAFDHRYNLDHAAAGPPRMRDIPLWGAGSDALAIPPLSLETLSLQTTSWDDWLPPQILLETPTADGRTIHLCDFASAGETGTPYTSWLPIQDPPAPRPFSRQNPLRSSPLV